MAVTTKKGHGEKLSRKQEAAIAALMTCPSIPQAAEQAKVGVRTLRRWIREPAFDLAYRTERRKLVEHAVSQLQGAMGQAVECLVRNLTDAVPSVQVKAAMGIMSLAFKGVELLGVAEVPPDDEVARMDPRELALLVLKATDEGLGGKVGS